MNYRQQIITELVPHIKAQGFRVFVAASSEYGFYTDADGTRVVSFGCDLGVTNFSGNYNSSAPASCGTGWRIGENISDFAAAFNAHAPRWAIGDNSCTFTTLAQHQKKYQSSSKYTEV